MSRVCSQEPGNLPGELLLILRVKGASYRSRRHEMMANVVSTHGKINEAVMLYDRAAFLPVFGRISIPREVTASFSIF